MNEDMFDARACLNYETYFDNKYQLVRGHLYCHGLAA